MHKPVFIIGVGRSGTSLLQSMLHAHPEIEFLPETQFLRKYVFNRKKSLFKNEVEKNTFLKILQEDEKFERTKVSPKMLTEEVISYQESYEKLLASVAFGNTAYVGDKDPRFLDFIPQLHALLPQAKIIHIIRDPRDVVLSRTKADWSKHWPFFMHAFMYHAQLERGRALGKKFFGADYYEFYYEDLIDSPKKKLASISAFLQLPYSDSMMDFGASAKDLVTEKEMQWKKETLGPLLSHNKEKWKTDLTAGQIYLVQKICKDCFKNHPYMEMDIKTSFYARSWGGLMFLLSRIFSFLYPLRIQFIK